MAALPSTPGGSHASAGAGSSSLPWSERAEAYILGTRWMDLQTRLADIPPLLGLGGTVLLLEEIKEAVDRALDSVRNGRIRLLDWHSRVAEVLASDWTCKWWTAAIAAHKRDWPHSLEPLPSMTCFSP